MERQHGSLLIASLAVSVMVGAGCVPESGTMAPSATPGLSADARAGAGDDECAGWSKVTFVSTTTSPETIQRCAALKGPGSPWALLRVASAAFHDTPDAAATRALLDAGADPNASGNSDLYTGGPLTTWARGGWSYRWQKKERRPVLRSPAIDEAVVRVLLEAGADPNAQRRLRYRTGRAKSLVLLFPTPRVGAVGFEWRVLHAAIGSNRPTGAIEALLEHGADPNLTVAPGQDWTALHVAAFMPRPDVIRLLLKHGADPHAVTTYRKWTALHALAEGAAGSGAAESGQLLLDAGIDPKARDHKRRTAWDLVRARLTPERLAALADENPEVGRVLARLKTATGG